MKHEIKRRKNCPAAFACALLIGLLSVTSAFAQNRPPPQADTVLSAADRKQTIDAMIREVGQRYVFPDVAKELALGLRERQKRGDFDRVTSAKELADMLDEHLHGQSKDKHMGVRYSEEALPVTATDSKPSEQEKAADLADMKRRNFGIERVERRPGNIGYIDLRAFMSASDAGDAIGSAMTLLNNTEALIIDLRKNGGGEPSTVALLASYFLDERTHLNDLFYRLNDSTEQFWSSEHVTGAKYGSKRDVYILTSARTFSAAEEFSYDMKALKRATIIGETTGGGAHPGDVYRLSPHFEMFIPTGRAINPLTKTNWDGVGVAPDVRVPQAKALAAAEAAALKKLISSAMDPQRKASLQQRLDEVEQDEAVKVSSK